MTNWIDRNIKWVFTMPAVIFVGLMMVMPVGYTFWLSFHDWNMSNITPPLWVALQNYLELFHDELFLKSLKLMFYFTIVAVTVETVLGVGLAVLMNQNIVGKGLVKTLFLLPMVATPVAVGLIWVLIYEPNIGIANVFLEKLGLPGQEWLTSQNLVMPSLIFIDVWEWTPMIALIVLAGLVSLPKDPYEAAMIDGANTWQSFQKITLPLLKPTLYSAVLLRMIDALKTFDIIYATTQGGPGTSSQTINIYGYVLGFQYFKIGQASALLMVFFIIVLSISIFTILLRNRAGVNL
ncbi:binding-protein-dependent transporters inner membrane component [Neobacillus bataviensis LMG 21833]|uniref:Binding-protein-dependent transporters inner membrane component n=1 Tax=Neobacillus bataviensis LMG 21833 TaxID=1117379 RepID=K6DLM1_9BACI|nr:sugar ABC transporter permease [Neobacillus bataviensis]EKN69063.1 binding-protein-dependent transporters inner membrane component [Neobacillus bataviensis LMG 21833]